MDKIFIVGKGFMGEHLCKFFAEKYTPDRVLYFTDEKEFKILNKSKYQIFDIEDIFSYETIDCLINSIEDINFMQELTKKLFIKQYHQIVEKKNKAIKDYLKTCPMKVTISYALELYGPGQSQSEIIPIWIKRVMKNKITDLKKNNERGWVFITDFCDAVDKIVNSGVDKDIYSVSSKYAVTDYDIILEIIRILHKPEVLVTCQNEEPLLKVRKNEKIYSLGWEPEVSLNRGLEVTIKWYFLDALGEKMKDVLLCAKK